MKNEKKNEKRSTIQIDAWTGRLGNDYMDRNNYADWKMPYGMTAYQRILGGLKLKSVLEVGSSIGLNLIYIQALFKKDLKLFAVEPNRKAFDQLVSQPEHLELKKAWNCDVFQLPLDDSSIDLVFTSGVLIHITPENLGRATDEIVRVARKYVLCIEYFSHDPEEKSYRGQRSLLFKRDFGAFYDDRFSDLKVKDYGFFWQREFPIFDNLNWWLFEKQSIF